MSFIKNCADYSQGNVLKSKYLKPILEQYNKHVIQLSSKISTCSKYSVIPNNNKKYYAYVTNKQNIEHCKEKYNILYFFPDKTIEHHLSDFFIEINDTFSSEYLFEGYLYKKDGKYTYLLTDILYQDGVIVDCDYQSRQAILNELVFASKKRLKHLNDHLTINVHQIFDSENTSLLEIFKNNFVFNNDLCAIEKISDFTKTNVVEAKSKYPDAYKIVKCGKYADVYDVYDSINGVSNGILYVKGVNESKILKEIFKSDKTQKLACTFNTTFNKWQAIV